MSMWGPPGAAFNSIMGSRGLTTAAPKLRDPRGVYLTAEPISSAVKQVEW